MIRRPDRGCGASAGQARQLQAIASNPLSIARYLGILCPLSKHCALETVMIQREGTGTNRKGLP